MPGNYPKRNKLHLEHGESLKTIQILLYQIQDTTFKQSVSEQLHPEKIKTAKCERVESVHMKKASAQTDLCTFFHSFVQLPSMLFKNHKFKLADLWYCQLMRDSSM